MAKLTLIVAYDAQRGIGVDNKLPWHLPEDLAHFKRLTSGHPILMGRKTFDSIGRALPNRRNIVITRNRDWSHEGVETAGSLPEAVAMVGEAQAFIIGGAQVFKESLGVADEVIATEIAAPFRCDTFFPELDGAAWEEAARETHRSEAQGVDYAFVTLRRITAK